jgi:hypothetical protein
MNTSSFRDLSGLAARLKLSLAAYIVIGVLSLWSGWLEIGILQRLADGTTVAEAEADASDIRQGVVAMLQILSFAVTGVLFLRWTYLAGVNARALSGSPMLFTPGWAVGWYFVPVATLWKPYQALKEIFRASDPDSEGDWQQASHPGLLPLWWTFWISSNMLGQAAFRTGLRAEGASELLTSSWVMWLSDAIDIPLGLAAIAVVAALQARQSEKCRRAGVLAV